VYNETVHQLFIDFKEAYDSVRREVLYNIITEFGVPMKLVRLIKMRLNETYSYSTVRRGKYLSGSFPIQNGIKQGDAAFQLYFRNAIRKFQENQVGPNLNGTHQLLAYADYVNILGDYKIFILGGCILLRVQCLIGTMNLLVAKEGSLFLLEITKCYK
jgi:hypothetical protein